MRIQQRLSLCIIFIMLLSLLGMVRPVNVTAQGMPEIGEIGEDQSPPVVGIQSTINSIYVWFGKEYGKTTIWLRACSDAPNFQLRSEQPGHWISEIFNRTTKEGGCSPATNSAWRMVYNADPGMQFNIYATASESWYGEAEFMARALRTTCTVTGYGTGYCTPSNYLSPVSVPRGWIDEPAAGTILTGVFTISGWALDVGSKSGTGVDSVHVYFNDTFLGTAYYGTPRSDVAVLHGDSRYTNSGWHMSLDAASLPAGPGVLRVAYRSTISGVYTWMDRNVLINTNRAPNPPTLIAPANAVTVTTPNLTLAIQDGGDPDNGPRPYRDFVFRITKSDNSWSAESGWTTSTSWNVTLPGHGEYHWQAMAGDGATISAWAGPRSLFYETPLPTSYTISGQIRTDRGDPLLGVIISDGTRRTTTDENGRYILENVPAGDYTLTPTKAGYRFQPVTRNVTVIGNLTGQDFTAISTESAVPIDLTVSLYHNPTSSQRTAYEEIIRYFADAIFEQSNGAHKLRTVRIFPNRGRWGRTDIQWVRSCWPRAHISGFGTEGLRIEMCDIFASVDFLRRTEEGGYVLAHELGHYYYGLYDEYRDQRPCNSEDLYKPCYFDTPVQNSIMNYQWYAVGGNYAWLNFSTSLNNTRNTAQHRVYRASGWETLARHPNQDPRDGILASYPRRLYHPELAVVAPSPNTAPRIDLVSGHQARSLLQIIWEPAGAAVTDIQAITAQITALDGATIIYPDPIRLLVLLQRDHPIAGAIATGEVVLPNGRRQTITLRDDGIAPDYRANDGLYSALVIPVENGDHQIEVVFRNPNGTAMELYDSGHLTPPPPGDQPMLPSPQPITDPFEIHAQLTVAVSGVPSTGSLYSPVSLPTTNEDQWGRLEQTGDVNLFHIIVPEDMTLTVRVTSISPGMQPHLRLLAADLQTELASVTGNTTTYPFITYYLKAGSTVYAEVSNQNPAAGSVVYQISAGPPLASDQSSLYVPLIVR